MAEEKKPAAEEILEEPSEEPTEQLRSYLEKFRRETAEWAAEVERKKTSEAEKRARAASR